VLRVKTVVKKVLLKGLSPFNCVMLISSGGRIPDGVGPVTGEQ
jgi:hypothetical protein